MYIDSEESKNMYSLNIGVNEFNDKINESNTKSYSFGFSTMMKARNEVSVDYIKEKTSKLLKTSYLYYIKPKFYLNFNIGFSNTFNYEEKENKNQIFSDRFFVLIKTF